MNVKYVQSDIDNSTTVYSVALLRTSLILMDCTKLLLNLAISCGWNCNLRYQLLYAVRLQKLVECYGRQRGISR